MRIGPKNKITRATPVGPPQKVESPTASTSGAVPDGGPVRMGDALGQGIAIGHFVQAAAKWTRSAGAEGQEALINRREAARLETCWPRFSLETQNKLQTQLTGFQGPAAGFARGLFLRAIAARAPLVDIDQAALPTVMRFGERLAGMTLEDLRAHGSVLDLDSSTNQSDLNPQAYWERRGTIHDKSLGDEQGDNDGLFQRFTGSCGPTVIQMVLAEADPIVAFAIHDSGITADSTQDDVAKFQRVLLETYGGIAVGRKESILSSRLRNGLGRLRSNGHLSTAQSQAILNHAFESTELGAVGKAGLKIVRDAFEGLPSNDDIKRLQQSNLRSDEGMSTEGFCEALNARLGPLTGVTYESTSPTDGFARGQAYRHMDKVARALRRGIDIPFGIREPAHWMMLSAVKGRKPGRQFLVSDPDGGRTAWVGEKDLLKGDFGDDPFQLCMPDERSYIDCFLLPSEESLR
jgi:hypothetical protein